MPLARRPSVMLATVWAAPSVRPAVAKSPRA